jgi:hypothetical protein
MKNKDYIMIKKENLKTIFVVFFMLALFSLSIFILVKNYDYDKEKTEEAVKEENFIREKEVFYDNDLRLYVKYENDFILAQTYQKKNKEVVKESLNETENQEVFSIFATPLSSEVVSCLLIGEVFESSDGQTSSNQFMSLNFHKDFENLLPETKSQTLAKQLKASVLDEETNIKEYYTQDVDIIDEDTFIIKGEGTINGNPIYFYQYSKVLGENLVNGIIGSRTEDKELLSKVANFVNSIEAK